MTRALFFLINSLIAMHLYRHLVTNQISSFIALTCSIVVLILPICYLPFLFIPHGARFLRGAKGGRPLSEQSLCSRCGKYNQVGAKTCSSCDNPLEIQ